MMFDMSMWRYTTQCYVGGDLLWYFGEGTIKSYCTTHIWLKLEASVAQLDAPSDWRPGGHRFNPRRGR